MGKVACRVEFDPGPYVRSHGDNPRGRGSWAFGREHRRRQDEVLFWSSGDTTYGEAKKMAKKWAEAAGFCGVLDVLP